MRAYVQHLNEKPRVDEYRRAKQEFCHVLEMNEPELFPKTFKFKWPKFSRTKADEQHPSTATEIEYDSSSVSEPESALLHQKDAKFSRTKDDEQQPSTATETEYDSSSVPKPESAILHQKDGNTSIELTNTTFGYILPDDTTVCVIENFSASFELGDRYAIMGETGCGKSTIIKGLAGLLKPIEGTISVGGKKVDMTSIQWRRDHIGVVSQESIMFNRSLRENITYGLYGDLGGGSLGDAILLEALDKVNMKQFVLEQLPNGLDTVINNNGNEFSGGQRQRLQICRLLLRNRPFVLLDECTLALDRATTQDILEVLKDFLADGQGKTLIMITHDIQTLDIARHTLNMRAGGSYEIQTSPLLL